MTQCEDKKILEPLMFEKSRVGRKAYSFAGNDCPGTEPANVLPESLIRKSLHFPEMSESDIVRHFVRLSQLNYSVDTGLYPLGSCTMKYNPKVNELVARFPGFTNSHPLQDEEDVQGNLQILWHLERMLSEITGLASVTLQPAAGAHGELTGMLIIRAYHENRSDRKRMTVLVPDSAHGTNPATSALCGYSVIVLPSNDRGLIDLKILDEKMDDSVAGIMLTNPNTLGLFEEDIERAASLIHERGGLVYCDGANMNALLGVARPGDMGVDVLHLNLHKTFSTPHGGGGPGSGPVAVREDLTKYLPVPRVVKQEDGIFSFDYGGEKSIGKVSSFFGNFGVIVRAYAYILRLGAQGVRDVAERAVLNANFLKEKLKPDFALEFDRLCKHEAIFNDTIQQKNHVSTLDIAKRLIDYGFHPPTIYFPLIVKGALMIEPTETESPETIEHFVEVLKTIAREAEENPELLHQAPHCAPLRRLDEVQAARKPIVRFHYDSPD